MFSAHGKPKISWWRLNLVVFALGYTHVAVAEEYPYLYRSAYFLGRGDTGIATADKDEAIFYNPAGLAIGQGIYKAVVLASPMIEVSQSTRDIVRQIALQKNDPTQTLRRQQGIPQHFGLNQFSGIILRRAALGAFAHSSSTLYLYKDPRKGALESISAHSLNDIGLTFSLAHSLLADNFYVGITAKYVKRTQAAFSANATETDKISNLSSEELAMQGTGTGADLGLMYRGQGRSPISWGLTIQDLGSTRFIPDQPTSLSHDQRALKDIKQTVNLGFAIEPGTKYSKFKMMADMRDVLNETQQDMYKKIHLGTELTVREVIGFTAGLNQGYGSFGAYIDIHFLRVDLGGYTEEVGERAGSRPDKRFYFKMALGL